LVAQILAARLDSEGIVAHLRGESFGPYPVTVGSMAETEVWVPDRLIEDARAILVEVERQEATATTEPAGLGISTNWLRSILWWVVAALLLSWILWVRVARFL